jgi:hypothetical protein
MEERNTNMPQEFFFEGAAPSTRCFFQAEGDSVLRVRRLQDFVSPGMPKVFQTFHISSAYVNPFG